MKYQIIGKNMNVSDAVKERVERKLDTLGKYFLISDDTVARVVITDQNVSQKIEVTINTPAGTLRTEAVHWDLFAGIGLAVTRLEGQIRRIKTRLYDRHKDGLSTAFAREIASRDHESGDNSDEIIKTKVAEPEVLDPDEAVIRMNMTDHSFYLYVDKETQRPSVIYRRIEGGYGCIELDAKCTEAAA